MRYLVKLAAKNLWRQKRRTFLTFIAIAVGLVTFIEVDSLLTGVDSIAARNLINLETGDVRVHAEGYFEDRDTLPIDKTVAARDVLSAVEGLDGLEGAAPRIVFAATLNTGTEELPVSGVAIDPMKDAAVFEVEKYVEGRLPGSGASEAALGRDLAQVLGLGMGDYVTLVTRTRDGAMQAIDLTVVGLVNSPHPRVNQATVFLPMDVAAPALGLSGRATEVALRFAEGTKVEAAAESVRSALAAKGIGAEVFTWKEAAADFLAISESKRTFTGMFLFLILIIATVGVVNTILLGAMERTKEIGMMKAMGMTEGDIILTFVFEAVGIGILGSLAGCLLGIVGVAYMVNVGVDMTGMIGDLDIGYPVTGVLTGAWNWGTIVLSFFFGVIVSAVASYLPARAAASQDAVKSLRQG